MQQLFVERKKKIYRKSGLKKKYKTTLSMCIHIYKTIN